VSQASPVAEIEWRGLRTRLNTLAARFGYPGIARG
jgi:hypothetical protein